MYEDKSRRKRRLIIMIVVVFALVLVVLITFSTRGGNSRNAKLTRTRVQQRREAIIRIMTAIEASTKANKNTPPTVDDVNRTILPNMNPQPVDPVSKKPFVVQSSPPKSSNQAQYVQKARCTDNLYAIVRTSSAKDVALLVSDDLTKFFCLSNRVNNGS